jgi:hypothetical protein
MPAIYGAASVEHQRIVRLRNPEAILKRHLTWQYSEGE